jgi:hypothetical protein
MTITFHYVDTISNIFFSNDSPSLSLQNCTFQSSPLQIFIINNLNFHRGVETFGPPFIINVSLTLSIRKIKKVKMNLKLMKHVLYMPLSQHVQQLKGEFL